MCVCVTGVCYPLAIQKVECLTRYLTTYTGETGVSRSSVTMRQYCTGGFCVCVCVTGVRYPLAIQKVECLTKFLPTYTGETGVSTSSVTMRHTVPKGIDRMYRGRGIEIRDRGNRKNCAWVCVSWV